MLMFPVSEPENEFVWWRKKIEGVKTQEREYIEYIHT